MKEILVVNDERAVRCGVRDMLKSAGYSVRTARDGLEGVAEWDRKHPDLVIMNGMMPRLNGIAAALRMRESDARVPILLMSAWCDKPAKIKELNEKYRGLFNDFIPSEFSDRDFQLMIEKYLPEGDVEEKGGDE